MMRWRSANHRRRRRRRPQWKPHFYVSSPPANGRQRRRWVLAEKGVLDLADWSYGHTNYHSLRDAMALALRAKVIWPERRFQVERSYDGNRYETVRVII